MWLILRTAPAKEHYVARQVQSLGYTAWVPAQVIVARKCIGRRVMVHSNAQSVKKLPILPRRIFVCADRHQAHALIAVRHAQDVERDGEERIVCIPDAQIQRFKAAIDAENTTSLALHHTTSKRRKARWRDMKDALVELIQGAKEQMEQAA